MHFPLAWALNHNINDETKLCGPEKCEYCFHYGCVNNVFVGYCAYCLHSYKGNRGKVYFTFPEPDDIIPLFSLNSQQLVDRYGYMNGVAFSDIGNDIATLERDLVQEKRKYYGAGADVRDTLSGPKMSKYFRSISQEVMTAKNQKQKELEKQKVIERERLHQYIQDDMYDVCRIMSYIGI